MKSPAFSFESLVGQIAGKVSANASGKRFARGAIWSLIAALLSQGLRLLSFVVVARILGVAGFGQLGMAQTTVLVIGVFAPLGLGLAATNHLARHKVFSPERAGRIAGLSFSGCGSLRHLVHGCSHGLLRAYLLGNPSCDPTGSRDSSGRSAGLLQHDHHDSDVLPVGAGSVSGPGARRPVSRGSWIPGDHRRRASGWITRCHRGTCSQFRGRMLQSMP